MIRRGMLHDTIAAIQSKLAELGHDPGPSDGWFGPLTSRAVASFQKAMRLSETGIIGPETAKQLGVQVDFSQFELPKLRQQLTLAKLDAGIAKQLASATKAASATSSTTYYEEVVSLGYQPQLDRLEAIVVLKQPSGYLGNPCEGGSGEHVRFYIDWAADGHWTDLGVVSFDTSDLPITGARTHAVHLQLRPELAACTTPRLPRVRAVLSWREVPPPNQPDWTPTWGNHLDGRIQMPARPKLILKDLGDILQGQVVPVVPKFSLPTPELQAIYTAKKIGPERFAAPKLRKLASGKSFSLASSQLLAEELTIDVTKLASIMSLLPTGSTHYERLEQVGYDSDRRYVAATVRLEQNLGYSGDLCHSGSREYVRFWRWDDADAAWINLGVSSVSVYDIPRDFALAYAVVLPVDFSSLRQPCQEGPVIVRIRATLSWNEEPPAGNPDWAPTWGNVVESRFDIEQGVPFATPTLAITAISNQAICQLGADGYYDDAAYQDRPFGGDVLIGGMFSHVTTLGPNRRLFYRVTVTPPTGSPELLNNGFKVYVNDSSTGIVHQQLVSQAAIDGWYEYLERPMKRVAPDGMLALWRTSGNGHASIMVEAQLRDASGSVIESVPCVRAECDASPGGAGAIAVMLDNEAPKIELTIDGGACHTYTVGNVVTGTFSVEDVHLASFGLAVEGAFPIGAVTTTTTLATATKRTGTWSLDTSTMQACGYVVRLSASDRTIAGGYAESPTTANYYVSGGYHVSTPSSGFCIVAKP